MCEKMTLKTGKKQASRRPAPVRPPSDVIYTNKYSSLGHAVSTSQLLFYNSLLIVYIIGVYIGRIGGLYNTIYIGSIGVYRVGAWDADAFLAKLLKLQAVVGRARLTSRCFRGRDVGTFRQNLNFSAKNLIFIFRSVSAALKSGLTTYIGVNFDQNLGRF